MPDVSKATGDNVGGEKWGLILRHHDLDQNETVRRDSEINDHLHPRIQSTIQKEGQQQRGLLPNEFGSKKPIDGIENGVKCRVEVTVNYTEGRVDTVM